MTPSTRAAGKPKATVAGARPLNAEELRRMHNPADQFRPMAAITL